MSGPGDGAPLPPRDPFLDAQRRLSGSHPADVEDAIAEGELERELARRDRLEDHGAGRWPR